MLPVGRGRGRGRGRGVTPGTLTNPSSASSQVSSPPGGLQQPGKLPVAVSPPAAYSNSSSSTVASEMKSMAPGGVTRPISTTLAPVAQPTLVAKEASALHERMEALRVEPAGSLPAPDPLPEPATSPKHGDRSPSPSSSTSGIFSRSASTASDSRDLNRSFQQRIPLFTRPMAAKLPRRPNFGKAGQKISLVTNHFEVKMKPGLKFYHYDVSIVECANGRPSDWATGRVPKYTRDDVVDRCYDVFATWATNNMGEDFFAFVYDKQQNVYSTLFLGKKVVVGEIDLGPDGRYQLTLAPNKEALIIEVSMEELRKVAFEESTIVDRSPMRIVELMHNQMMYYTKWLNKSGYTQNRRCFYSDDIRTMTPMPMGRVLKDGFIRALHLINGPSQDLANPQPLITLNIDAKMSPFHKSQDLGITASEILNMDLTKVGRDGLKHAHIEQLRLHLRDVRVQAKHNKRIYTIFSISDKPAYAETFVQEGQRITIADYFAQIASPLSYPSLPCAVVVNRNLIPLEKLFVLPNQKVDLPKLTAEQSSIIIKKSAVPPDARREKIMRKSGELMGEEDKFLKRLGFERSKDMMKVQGRVLTAPVISYANRKINVRAGSWQVNQCKVLRSAKITVFAIICLERNLDEKYIAAFTKGIIGKARQMGMQMPNDCSGGGYKKPEEFLSYLDEIKRQSRNTINLAFVIMPDKGSPKVRSDIKYAEKETEIVTQCLLPKTVKRYYDKSDDMLLENIVLKLNVKCGGLNNDIVIAGDPVATKWFTDDVMFVGFDVNHPAALSKREIAQGVLPKKPSVVGAVANGGPSIFDYFMVPRVQDTRQEEISESNIDAVFQRALFLFEKHRGALPKRVIVYRDGVSESQFEMVQNRETLAMKNALAKFGCSPKLSVVTVQKRHNTRFFRDVRDFPPRMKNAEKNIPAGTVVDSGPVGPFQFDFFLASHAGIQGTTKAPYYVTIHDENKFDSDELQILSYLLCHVYQRATKSVSLPAPCYFAHLAATRGKELTEGFMNISDEASSGVSSQSDGSASTSSGRVLLDYDEINKRIDYSFDFGSAPIFL